jgi:hypothetical protein
VGIAQIYKTKSKSWTLCEFEVSSLDASFRVTPLPIAIVSVCSSSASTSSSSVIYIYIYIYIPTAAAESTRKTPSFVGVTGGLQYVTVPSLASSTCT